MTEMTSLLDAVIAIAEAAGQEILQVYGQADFGERIKADKSPLTEADLAAHRAIAAALQQLTPDIPLLSEESAAIAWAERQGWQRYWLVDPLDGTKEFIKRNGEFTVNIALIQNHKPVLGVVHAPVLAETWCADDSGAFKIDAKGRRPIQIKPHQTGEVWRVVGSRSHAGDSLKAYLNQLGEHELVSMGSSIKLCLVAEGSAHIYPRLGPTSEWDTAAAHAVVLAAGGVVVEAESDQPLRYNTKESLLNPFFIVRGQ